MCLYAPCTTCVFLYVCLCVQSVHDICVVDRTDCCLIVMFFCSFSPETICLCISLLCLMFLSLTEPLLKVGCLLTLTPARSCQKPAVESALAMLEREMVEVVVEEEVSVEEGEQGVPHQLFLDRLGWWNFIQSKIAWTVFVHPSY